VCSVTDELRSRAENAIEERKAIQDQLEKLSSLESSGGVSSGTASEIREELGRKVRDVHEMCRKIADEIEENLKSLEGEMAARRKEREVIEAKHKIGALDEHDYMKKISSLVSGVDKIGIKVTELTDLAEKLEGVNTDSGGIPEKPPVTDNPLESGEKKGLGGEKNVKTKPGTCRNCGAENRPGAKFCKSCGSKLVAVETKGGGASGAGGKEAGVSRDSPRRVLFLGVHSTRVIGDKVSGYEEVFGFLTGMGIEVKYEVASGRGPINPVTDEYLEKFGAIFVLGAHNDRLDPRKIMQKGEVDVLRGFVARGGGLLLTPCIYGSGFNYLEVKEGLSDLCLSMGVSFPEERGDLIDPAKRVRGRDDHYPGKKDDWALIEAGEHSLVKDLGKVGFGPHGGTFLKINENPGNGLLGGVEVVLETGKNQEPPGAPVMTLSSYGQGRVVVFGCPTAFMYPELLTTDLVDNAKLLKRVVELLLE